MRWLVLTDDWAMPGGVASVGHDLVHALEDHGHDVRVLARAANAEVAVPVHGPSFARWGGVWTALAARSHLGWADRILATTWPVASTVSRLPWRPPIDVLLHGSDWTAVPPGRRDRVLGRVDRVWAVSRFLADQAAQVGIDARLLPLPVDPREGSVGRRGWVFVGRALPDKGGDRFLRLLAAAGTSGRLIGDGPALPAWRALASEIGAEVVFDGMRPREEVRRRLGEAELVFLLSRPGRDGRGTEGLGLVGLEAMSVGTPVVGCRTGGIPEASNLVLDDPDDVEGSVAAIAAWRPRDPRPWLAAFHGSARSVDALVS